MPAGPVPDAAAPGSPDAAAPEAFVIAPFAPVGPDSPAAALIRTGRPQGARPFERYLLTPGLWLALREALAADPATVLLGLWGEPGMVHAAFLDESAGLPLLASLPAPQGHYPALSPVRPGAALMERATRDLWRLDAEGADPRPWLDHGRWPVTGPLAERPVRHDDPPPQPEFIPVAGEGIHQIPVGPVHAGVIEPGHFRFHVRGEAILKLEARLGYTHKGTLSLLRGRSPRAAAKFASRISGDSAVAHSWAFAAAAEAAAGIPPPPRALALRALLAELERIANHLNDWGFICNDAAFALPHASCGALREGVLRACHAAFGHRLLMDVVVPGGVARDLAPEGAAALEATLSVVAAAVPDLLRLYDNTASLQDRTVGTGAVAPALAAAYGAGGHVGRASGRRADARLWPGYAPYGALGVAVPVLTAGDVDARVRIRVAELRESLRLADTLLAALPPGPVQVPLPAGAGEGVGLVEGFRGEVLHWLRLDREGLIEAAFVRDPSWMQWPLLELAVLRDIVADFPLCNKSFNCSYSGVDL
nr:nickel-dependent hydrogenase large subunit [Roseomonas acroporae]